MNYTGKEDDYWPMGHKMFIFNRQVDTLEYPEKSLSEGLDSSDWPGGAVWLNSLIWEDPANIGWNQPLGLSPMLFKSR